MRVSNLKYFIIFDVSYVHVLPVTLERSCSDRHIEEISCAAFSCVAQNLPQDVHPDHF